MFRVFSVIVLILCGVYTYIECKVCQSMDIRNSITNLGKLRNCTEIAGYLRIVLMEKAKESDFEDYVFPELTHITGYLLLFDVFKLTSVAQLFPNLRAIRGRELFLNAVLIIYQMPDLREIGTEKLMFIGKGMVIVDRVPFLCFVDTIDWKKIGASGSLIYDHGKDCEACPRQCGEYCWNSFKCQETDTDKCHKECLGCNKYNSSKDCLACKNFDDHGECVAECPSTKIIHTSYSKCITEEQCRNNLDGTVKGDWFVFNNTCINDCPQNYRKEVSANNKTTTCTFCGDKCSKYCTVKEPLESMNDIEKLHGCTHIDGSIILRYGGIGINELELYFSSVKRISGGLVIARSQYIRTLDFLANLTEIEGKNLDNRYALLMYENQNLEHLWNFSDPNFKLKIRNGTIGFHNNPLLCLSEITQLSKAVQIVYNETDVSRNSNGDKASCSIIDLHVEIRNLTSRNATVVWQTPKCDKICIGYTIFYKVSYKKDGSKFNSKDVCLDNQWNSIFTSNTTLLLKGLLPFKTYAFYIKFYQSSGLPGSETNLTYFKTLPDKPPVPQNVIAVALSPDTIQLQWNQSAKNGILSHYRVIYYRIYMDVHEQRDYCTHPRTIEGEAIDLDSKLFPKFREYTGEITLNTSCHCKKPLDSSPDISFLTFDFSYPSCDKDALSKYGIDQCQFIEYDVSNNTQDKFSVAKRNGQGARQLEDKQIFTKKIDAEGPTVHNFTNLEHFTTYVFHFSACNFFNKSEKTYNCSEYVYTFTRTLRKVEADDITNVTVNVIKSDVRIDWAEPTDPNMKTVTYTIVYRQEAPYAKPIRHCIAKNSEFNGSYWSISNLGPGKYSIKVQSESLAGPGRYSRSLYFEIPYPPNDTPTVVVSSIVTIICILAAVLSVWFWYRKKQQLDNLHLIATINPDYDTRIYVSDEWEVDRNDIEIQTDLGHGTFGIVFRGKIKSTNLHCAIKTINENRSLHERMEFLNEASVMKAFSNCQHVVKLLGVVSKGEPPLVVMELMENGDLKKFLHRMRDSMNCLTAKDIYRMAIEIADGMAYLAAKKFVHRDLAARNCMVDGDRTVKIGDFGMARDVYETDYYKKESKGLLPVRWMAPESLADGVFTSDSDVWSYGIVLWEIATLAQQPYQGLSNEEVLRFVVSKGRLERPTECCDILYNIMISCWSWRPNDRPTFWDIVERLEGLVGQQFRLVSFVHSNEGIEHRAIREKQRVYNPPALASTFSDDFSIPFDNLDNGRQQHSTTDFEST